MQPSELPFGQSQGYVLGQSVDFNARFALHKRNLYFPRYHQLDVVRCLVQHASTHGAGLERIA